MTLELDHEPAQHMARGSGQRCERRAPERSGGGSRAPPSQIDCAAMFEKVLIANRGEIAIRVIRTLKEMGIASVAVYSEIDRDAPHVREADEAFLIGPAVPAESYLNIEKIIDDRQGGRAPRRSTPATASSPRTPTSPAPATRPGSPWIGPPAEAIEAMGSKTRAREIMEEAGVPIVPGATEPSPRTSTRPASRPKKPATRSPARRPAAAAARASASR